MVEAVRSTKLSMHYYREEEYDYRNQGKDWNFALAKKGQRQSPIDIPFDAKPEFETYDNEVELKDFEVILGTTVLDTQIVAEHLNFTVPIPEAAFRVVISDVDGKKREFQVIHYYFHCGSEHTLNGKRHDAELRIVARVSNSDRQEKNTRAIFSILFTTDKTAGARGLEKIFDSIVQYPKPFKAPVEDLATFLALNARFFAYRGSITTPPCTENVNWYIVTQLAFISPENLKMLKGLFTDSEGFAPEGNVRQIQPLNGREIKILRNKAFDEEQAIEGLPSLDFNPSRLRSVSISDNVKISKLTVEYYETFGWDFTKEGDDWCGDLCKSFARQSPIDIPFDYHKKEESYPDEKIIKLFNVKVNDPNLVATITRAHLNFRVSIPYETASIEIEGASGKVKHYEVQEYHFHSNSEHTFQGKRLEAELHIVTRQTNKKHSNKETRAVFGILLTSDENIGTKGLDKIYEGINTYPASFTSPIQQIAEFINKNSRFFVYKGSLTTPPCSENVNWHVLTQPAYGKEEDLKTLRSIYGDKNFFSKHGTARRAQALNDRSITVLRSNNF